ncbi:hypothetical protein PPTG_25019 [Phytophthora nicotianae INRA-310]|uniref:Uncharacterized protein n=1 Tax=Phytophthora nicotianae (strain INRA-310) TaxID=761204 RepID=W2P9H8_PHYN3|nr:hypothetical protein PPTG_25019 [Phytophthora nicotianae INRA-310]ETM97295.1 hypothetical protein PPTG_25019 [Phytophthora nicotianae INRA-310]
MTSAAAANTRKRKNLTPAERAEVVAFFLRVSKELQPPIAVQNIKAGHPINYDSGKKGRSGRKTRMTEEFRHDLNHAIELILLGARTDIRTLANTLGIPKFTRLQC